MLTAHCCRTCSKIPPLDSVLATDSDGFLAVSLVVRNGENLTKSPHAVYIRKWYSNQPGCSKWCLVLFSTRTCGAPSNTSWDRWVPLFLKNINNIRHFAQVVQEPIFCQFVWFVLATHGSIPWCLEWNCLFHGPNTTFTPGSWVQHHPIQSPSLTAIHHRKLAWQWTIPTMNEDVSPIKNGWWSSQPC